MYWLRMKARTVAALLLPLLAMMGLQAPAHAALVGTQEVLAQAGSELDRQELLEMLQREEVRDRLIAAGVDPERAAARVEALTDAEIAQLDAHFGELPAGGADIIGAALLVFFVLLITDIAGFTDVFPFVKKTYR